MTPTPVPILQTGGFDFSLSMAYRTTCCASCGKEIGGECWWSVIHPICVGWPGLGKNLRGQWERIPIVGCPVGRLGSRPMMAERLFSALCRDGSQQTHLLPRGALTTTSIYQDAKQSASVIGRFRRRKLAEISLILHLGLTLLQKLLSSTNYLPILNGLFSLVSG